MVEALGKVLGVPMAVPEQEGTSLGSPPIAACTGCFFCLRAADAGSAPSCLSGGSSGF